MLRVYRWCFQAGERRVARLTHPFTRVHGESRDPTFSTSIYTSIWPPRLTSRGCRVWSTRVDR